MQSINLTFHLTDDIIVLAMLVRKDSPPMKNRRVKDILDIVLTSVLLISLAPILILTAILLKLEGLINPGCRGPIFYRETRISKGKPFQIYKFRTVRRDVLKGLQTQSIPGSISQFTSSSCLDKRAKLTPVGRMLTSVYFDELPQLFNILKGDMSLVGPRPLSPDHYADDLAMSITSLTQIKAGLFGIIQASKGNHAMRKALSRLPDRSPTQTMHLRSLDSFYFCQYRDASSLELLRTDLWIIWRCLHVVVKAEGI